MLAAGPGLACAELSEDSGAAWGAREVGVQMGVSSTGLPTMPPGQSRPGLPSLSAFS